ncbi:phosphatase 2C-like domain-containing protein, partial [Umbelopsis sp. PMI_123]
KEPQEDTDSDYNFVVAASWHPKTRARKSRTTAEKIPYWKRTQVGKVDAGEDAFFHTSTRKGLALGVADGVGGWAEVGVDPALFSWTLMNNCASIAKDLESVNAHDILDNAFTQLVDRRMVQAGSSTACILEMCKKTGYMTSCNLGDSAFILIRDQKIVFESPSQQHFFNCPYQLTVLPDNDPNRGTYVTDLPKDGDRKSFFLRNGDLIILATDGYFDNVYSHETLQIVNTHMQQLTDDSSNEDSLAHVRVLAKLLTDAARRLSLDPKRLSPWAKGARALGGQYGGGKVDDITCIVTLV